MTIAIVAPVLGTVSRTIAAPSRPLAQSDDRDRFDCGRESMNAWFRRHAWFSQANNLSRVTVVTDPANGRADRRS